jgi:hypothetical protein
VSKWIDITAQSDSSLWIASKPISGRGAAAGREALTHAGIHFRVLPRIGSEQDLRAPSVVDRRNTCPHWASQTTPTCWANTLANLCILHKWVLYFMRFNLMQLNHRKCELVGRGLSRCAGIAASMAIGLRNTASYWPPFSCSLALSTNSGSA